MEARATREARTAMEACAAMGARMGVEKTQSGNGVNQKTKKGQDRPREGRLCNPKVYMQRNPQLDTPGSSAEHAGPSAHTEMRANTATTMEKKGPQCEGSHSEPWGERGSGAPEDNAGNPFPICDILKQNTDGVHASHEMQKQKITRQEAPF